MLYEFKLLYMYMYVHYITTIFSCMMRIFLCRLDMAIRLLSNQVSPLTAPTSHQATPTLVRALSSAVWGETRCYSEEDFR